MQMQRCSATKKGEEGKEEERGITLSSCALIGSIKSSRRRENSLLKAFPVLNQNGLFIHLLLKFLEVWSGQSGCKATDIHK